MGGDAPNILPSAGSLDNGDFCIVGQGVAGPFVAFHQAVVNRYSYSLIRKVQFGNEFFEVLSLGFYALLVYGKFHCVSVL